MKRTLFMFLAFISTFNAQSKLYGQLSVYAGTDTILCSSNFQDYQLGNNVEINGEYDSISYSWSCEYKTPIGTLYASDFLNDTSISNPTLIGGRDTLNFTLEVTDDKGNKASDIIRVIFSQFIFCLADCVQMISVGDSASLGHCIDGGIPPYKYEWDNKVSLSNPFIANPWAKPDNTTTYNLTLTDSAGCIAHSRCRVIVFPVSSENVAALNYQINVFPNPTANGRQLTVENPSIVKFTIKFYDVQGRLHLEKNIDQQVSLIESNSLNSGIYLYNIIIDDKVIQTGKIAIN